MKQLPLLALVLAGCTTTTTNDEGETTTSRLDAGAATEIVKAGLDAYERIDRYNNPAPVQVHQPVYQPYPVYPVTP